MRPARGAVSRWGADGDSHSHRAGGSGPRSPAVSRGHPRGSAARPASALEIPAAPRPPLHRRRRRRGRSGTTRGCGRRRGRSPRSSRRIGPICAPSMKPSRGCGPSKEDLRAADARAAPHRASSACAASAASTISRRSRSPPNWATRAASPRRRGLMAYVGLIPSEHSSGTKRARGAITKTGNAHLRRVLVEAAWHYRHHPFVGRRAAPPPTRRARRPSSRRRGGAAAAPSALPAPRRARQTQTARRHRRRARAHRLRLGGADPVS